ncbi:MAG: 4-hydroxythreonine-4-phosphate dehydrogenase PdxA [Pseudomonadota bacterium]
MNALPIIGITMGDPSGIGPEIISKALVDPEISEICRPVILGDPYLLAENIKPFEKILINRITQPSEAKAETGKIDLIGLSKLDKSQAIPGKPTPEGGRAMVRYIVRAVEMAQRGEIAAMVTCPISKTLLNEAGHPFEGHTQLIAHLTNSDNYVMMLAGERLRVSLVTIHCALKEVPYRLHGDKIFETITITSKALQRDFGFERPRLAVAALNPHAGEAGLFGSEEEEIIKPAVARALGAGHDVTGPLPADTLFHKAAMGEFDAVVAMYHDQGLIPLKLLHFSDAVNITLGLPIVRTSVDHGTAYDIAGKGIADPSSLRAAIRMAVMVSENRAKCLNLGASPQLE